MWRFFSALVCKKARSRLDDAYCAGRIVRGVERAAVDRGGSPAPSLLRAKRP
jgi:hypothetical protein